MFKKLICSLLTIPLVAGKHHEIEIAIIKSDISALNSLLMKPLPSKDKEHYLELARDMRNKYSQSLRNCGYKKAIQFTLGGIALIFGAFHFTDAVRSIDDIDDLRRKNVVLGLLGGTLLTEFGIEKIYSTYIHYNRNLRYRVSLAIEELIARVPTI